MNQTKLPSVTAYMPLAIVGIFTLAYLLWKNRKHDAVQEAEEYMKFLLRENEIDFGIMNEIPKTRTDK